MHLGKAQHIQIRVSADEKAAIQRRAEAAGMNVSEWLLAIALPRDQRTFIALCDAVREQESRESRRYALAELNEFLATLSPFEFETAVSQPPRPVDAFIDNYVAAMVEMAAYRLNAMPPEWTAAVPPLDRPHFGVPYEGLRLHLLMHSPPPFRRRNLFIDSSVGDRV